MIRRSLAAALAACSIFFAAAAHGDDARSATSFTLLYTTDIHAHYQGRKEKDGGFAGSMAAIAAKVEEIRKSSKDPVFLVDSGDMMTGHPVSDMVWQGVTGGALYQMMNLTGYDAWCIGNHDWDHGRENVSKIVELLKFPTLSANLTVTGDPPIKLQRWTILEKGGVKLGVFGLMTEHFADVTGRDKVQGIKVTSVADAAREAVAALTSKCDVIVALSHCGSDDDIKLCDEVQGIDVILSGHNHRSLRPALHGNTIVAEGAIWAEKLGRLDLHRKKGGRLHFDGSLLKLEPAEAQGEFKKILDEVHETVGKRLEEVLATLDGSWHRENGRESNIGNFFADGLRAYAKADCAFLNSGGIRADHAAGNLTLGDVLEIFPFENATVAFDLSGEDLKRACEKNASAAAGNEYGILQISGVRYEWKHDGRTAEVTNVTVNGQPIDPKKKYRCAAIDFIAVDQPEKYFGNGVKVENLEKLNILLSKVAEDWVRDEGKKGPIKAVVDGRMAETK